MRRVIHLGEKEIIYTLKQSRRARRHMRVSIDYSGNVVVTVPRHIHQNVVEQFVTSKLSWILKKLAYIASLGYAPVRPIGRQDYMRHKTSAKLLAENRLHYFNAIYELPYGRVAIRNQMTRWGSCSDQGNLNFNYKIAFLPPTLADYIIVHELCHIAQPNHSQAFWHLVSQAIPDHAALRRALKKTGTGFC